MHITVIQYFVYILLLGFSYFRHERVSSHEYLYDILYSAVLWIISALQGFKINKTKQQVEVGLIYDALLHLGAPS